MVVITKGHFNCVFVCFAATQLAHQVHQERTQVCDALFYLWGGGIQ